MFSIGFDLVKMNGKFNLKEAEDRLNKKMAESEALRQRLEEIAAETSTARSAGATEKVIMLGKEAEQIIEKLITIMAR